MQIAASSICVNSNARDTGAQKVCSLRRRRLREMFMPQTLSVPGW